jgi:hypothetical protein
MGITVSGSGCVGALVVWIRDLICLKLMLGYRETFVYTDNETTRILIGVSLSVYIAVDLVYA